MMQPSQYGYSELCQETQRKIRKAIAQAYEDQMLPESDWNTTLEPVNVTPQDDGLLAITVRYSHGALGTGAQAGTIYMHYDHKTACYHLFKYDEAK